MQEEEIKDAVVDILCDDKDKATIVCFYYRKSSK
jgi:hypothetical protein